MIKTSAMLGPCNTSRLHLLSTLCPSPIRSWGPAEPFMLLLHRSERAAMTCPSAYTQIPSRECFSQGVILCPGFAQNFGLQSIRRKLIFLLRRSIRLHRNNSLSTAGINFSSASFCISLNYELLRVWIWNLNFMRCSLKICLWNKVFH